MWRVNHHFRRRAVIVGVTGGWVRTHRASYKRHSRCWGMIRLKYKEYAMLGCTSFRSLENNWRTQLGVCRVVDIVPRNVSRSHLSNYDTVKMYQTDRVLRQFRFRQSILVAPKVLDKVHKINLRRLNTYWPVFHAEYIEMWENQYDNIPTHESIIVSELACDPNYMSWFRIYGEPINSAYAITDPYVYLNPSDYVNASHFSMTLSQPTIYRPLSQEGPHEAPSGSSTYFQSLSPYEI
ncbi:hypothetical protein Gogos_006382 [Gossypium gossypioides]|uniref:Aminotransferase-like plant mobile domain-containing protein n=1 Tax=Gossypium gossypioides TaxID=34282 RepID=A0A7J9C5F5_GOSGO|nr:hypothetical protein [Gossypium gossypioides]